jgi:hypothetical protein
VIPFAQSPAHSKLATTPLSQFAIKNGSKLQHVKTGSPLSGNKPPQSRWTSSMIILDTSTLPPNMLVPIAGVATDKLLALRGEVSLTIRHDHFHQITDDDIVAFAIARSKPKPVQATVIDSDSHPALPDAAPPTAPVMRLQAKKTTRKKAG